MGFPNPGKILSFPEEYFAPEKVLLPLIKTYTGLLHKEHEGKLLFELICCSYQSYEELRQ